MIRVNKIRFKHFSLLISLLVSNGILFSCSKPDNIQIKTSNDTLISGIQEFSQTTISVESAKQLNMNQTDWKNAISSDLANANEWTNYLRISNYSDNQCQITFQDSLENFSDFNLFIQIRLNAIDSNQLTIKVRDGEPLNLLFTDKTFAFANDGSPPERFYARNAFAFNQDTIPDDIQVDNLIPKSSQGDNGWIFTSDIPKYFDEVTFIANLRIDSSVKFDLNTIIPPAFHDFSHLDYSSPTPIKLSPNIENWSLDGDAWDDFWFDFAINFNILLPEYSYLGFDNYFQVLHEEHIVIDNIDSANGILTLKGDNTNYYTNNLIAFTGVEFTNEI